MSTPKTVGIVGARGHTGAELIRLVAAHPNLQLGFVSSRELAGQRVSDHYPQWQGELQFENLDADAVAAKGVDAVILALPNGLAAPFVAALETAKPDTVIVDLSAYQTMFAGGPDGPNGKSLGMERWEIDPAARRVTRTTVEAAPHEFAGFGRSQAGLAAGIRERFGLAKTLSAVKNVRNVRKQHLIHNGYLPTIEVDPQNYQVKADGQLLWCEPAEVLPMAQRYFLF